MREVMCEQLSATLPAATPVVATPAVATPVAVVQCGETNQFAYLMEIAIWARRLGYVCEWEFSARAGYFCYRIHGATAAQLADLLLRAATFRFALSGARSFD